MRPRKTVHAAKIPEHAQHLTEYVRKIKGIEMVNACDNKPWTSVPLDFPRSEVAVCARCSLIVEQDRRRRGGGASI